MKEIGEFFNWVFDQNLSTAFVFQLFVTLFFIYRFFAKIGTNIAEGKRKIREEEQRRFHEQESLRRRRVEWYMHAWKTLCSPDKTQWFGALSICEACASLNEPLPDWATGYWAKYKVCAARDS